MLFFIVFCLTFLSISIIFVKFILFLCILNNYQLLKFYDWKVIIFKENLKNKIIIILYRKKLIKIKKTMFLLYLSLFSIFLI